MSEIPCQYPECDYTARHASEAVAIAMFSSHLLLHQQNNVPNVATSQKLPPIQRPEIHQDVSDEDWETFVAEWGHFKRCTSIPAASVADHLYQCCEKGLARLLIREDPEIISKGENALLEGIKRLAVIKVATSVRRTNLLSAKQSHGEKFREFYANVKAAASTCNYTVKCPNECCNNHPRVDYSTIVIKDVLIAGIADPEIRKEVLSWPELDEKNDRELVAFVEAKEIARNAWNNTPISATAGISNYRKGSRHDNDGIEHSLKKKLQLKGTCSVCKREISLYKRFQNGRVNKRAFTSCQTCHKKANTSNSNNNGVYLENGSEESESSAITSFFIGSIEVDCKTTCISSPVRNAITFASNPPSSINAVILNHHIFTNDGWKQASKLTHPSLQLQISTNGEDYRKFGIKEPRITPTYIDVIVDSGAQSCLWSRQDFLQCGFSMKDLIPVQHEMKAVNTESIATDGAILLRLSGKSRDGKKLRLLSWFTSAHRLKVSSFQRTP